MAKSASLALLKGATDTAVKEPAKPAAPAAAAPAAVEEQEIDVDKLGSKELGELLAGQGVEPPEGWGKFSLTGKRDWVKQRFGDDGTAAEAQAAPVADAKVDEPAPKKETPVSKAIEKAAPKEKKPPKAKATAVAEVSKTGAAEVLEPDELSDIVHTIENLSEKDALAAVGQLAEDAEFASFRLGGVLSRIQANAWFAPYANFKDYVEKEHGIHYRKAMYTISIYNDLVASGVPWSKVKDLGWTKLKEIASLLTPDNVDQWVEIAKKQTVLELIETVKNSKSADAPKQIEGDGKATSVTTKTFKVHTDQLATINAAIDKAKEISQTSVDTVAFEHICLDFLGSAKAVPLEEQLKKAGVDAALAALEKAFPDHNFQVMAPEAKAKA